jgi:hypothetical protein
LIVFSAFSFVVGLAVVVVAAAAAVVSNWRSYSWESFLLWDPLALLPLDALVAIVITKSFVGLVVVNIEIDTPIPIHLDLFVQQFSNLLQTQTPRVVLVPRETNWLVLDHPSIVPLEQHQLEVVVLTVGW